MLLLVFACGTFVLFLSRREIAEQLADLLAVFDPIGDTRPERGRVGD
ncbi:hypothetical protein IVB27_39095 [Bradyrhizobium sp. 197]|nr:hypothetical protein [Bradyrhizobium sp. 197]MCK1480581.1 hypothetical protein [Bradyrhizobium sp. 197]